MAQEPKDAAFEGCLWPTLLDVNLHLHIAPPAAGHEADAAARHRAIVDEASVNGCWHAQMSTFPRNAAMSLSQGCPRSLT
jgi:hypothetical protein